MDAPAWMPQCLPAIDAETERLVEDSGALSQAEWDRTSVNPGWVVGNFPVHLAFAADMYAAAVDNARSGSTESPWPPGATPADRQQAYWRPTPAEGSSLLRERADALRQVFASVQGQDMDKPAWHHRGTRPIWIYIVMRLHELVMHRWDFDRSLGREARLSAGSLPYLVDLAFARLLPQFLNRDVAGDLTCVIAFDIDGQRRLLEIAGGTAREVEAATPAAIVGMSSEDFMLAVAGRAQWPATAGFDLARLFTAW
ncbi:MAG: maleylpyruvate isomerase family mycothiol-dependent enzyme [Chloroflexi bacterium]|nr:maleylpyruvate isomerase family mycothiol-dependent enzyme [Chloroflexota bacterium]